MKFELPPLTPESLSLRATDLLRDAVLSGRFRPGDRLKEAELSEQLGVSRAPVREALRRLEHEGLVASLPYRATEVLGISQEEVAEVLVPIRLTLESFAFRRALPLLSDEDLAVLAQQVETMHRAAAAGERDELALADVRFHEHVIERSGQPHCLQIWRTIEPRVRAYFRRDASIRRRLEEIAEEHAALLEVLRLGDEGQVLETLHTHINTFLTPDGRGGFK
jgi:DNA-binding GntR family transcriptional regulator